MTELNTMEAYIEWGNVGIRFICCKQEEYFIDGVWVCRPDNEIEFSSEELSGRVLVDGVEIIGNVQLRGGKVFSEPENGWTLEKFMEVVEIHEFEWRSKPVNFFLGEIDRQHVGWGGISNENGVYTINWN